GEAVLDHRVGRLLLGGEVRLYGRVVEAEMVRSRGGVGGPGVPTASRLSLGGRLRVVRAVGRRGGDNDGRTGVLAVRGERVQVRNLRVLALAPLGQIRYAHSYPRKVVGCIHLQPASSRLHLFQLCCSFSFRASRAPSRISNARSRPTSRTSSSAR